MGRFTAAAGFYLALGLGLVPTCSAFRSAERKVSQASAQVACDESRRNLENQQGYHSSGQKDFVNGSESSIAAPCHLETTNKKTSRSSHEESEEPEPFFADMEDGDDILPPPKSDPNSFIDLDDRNQHVDRFLGRARPWPNGIIRYRWHNQIVDEAKHAALRAMKAWERKTCIKFEEVHYGSSSSYDRVPPVVIKSLPNRPCKGHVGFVNSIEQSLNLGRGCWNFGNALHELGHVIGLEHEHNRASRDDYIFINRGRIKHGMTGSFSKLPSVLELPEVKAIPYDMSSVMHYAAWQFSREQPQFNNSDTWTIHVKKADAFGNCEMGQRARISRGDIMKVAAMYGCGDLPNITETERWNELFHDEDCKDKEWPGDSRWDCSTVTDRTMSSGLSSGAAFCRSPEVQHDCPRACAICSLTTPMCFKTGRNAMAKFADTNQKLNETKKVEDDDTWFDYFQSKPTSHPPDSVTAEANDDVNESKQEPSHFHSEGLSHHSDEETQVDHVLSTTWADAQDLEVGLEADDDDEESEQDKEPSHFHHSAGSSHHSNEEQQDDIVHSTTQADEKDEHESHNADNEHSKPPESNSWRGLPVHVDYVHELVDKVHSLTDRLMPKTSKLASKYLPTMSHRISERA